MTRTLAVANQKGGVAKTTTVASLGAALVELGKRVLLVDLDPQSCLTFSLGIDPEDLDTSIHQVLLGEDKVGNVVVTVADGPDLLPATIDLATTEVRLLTQTGREQALRVALDEVRGDYDWVLLDCPPSLGVLTVAALSAADLLLVPLQCETLSHRGVGQLLDTRARRPPVHQPRPAGPGRAADPLRRSRQPRPHSARGDLVLVRPAGAGAADPAHDPVR